MTSGHLTTTPACVCVTRRIICNDGPHMSGGNDRHWATRARRRAKRHDERRRADTTRFDPLVVGWALGRLATLAVASPLWAPALVVSAAVNHAAATRRSAHFAAQLDRMSQGRQPLGPANRTIRLPAHRRMVVLSDMHRAPEGPLDWPGRQRTRPIVDAMLDHYATGEWTLCENGDMEEFWLVGGNAEGVAYDALRTAGAVAAAVGRHTLLDTAYCDHLDSIVDNNATTYGLIRDGFVAHDRYVRLVGNHDDPLSRPGVATALVAAVGTGRTADYLVLERDGSPDAVVTHGHHTDGWNGPDDDLLGKFATWFASMVNDVPLGPDAASLPDHELSTALLSGRAANRLLNVHRIFGVNAEFDTMDEELLFDAIARGDQGPWVIMGHTHSPVVSPMSRTGRRWTKYANAGSGVWPDLVTAVEYDGTTTESTVTLVAWTTDPDDPAAPPRRTELRPAGDRLSVATGVTETADAPV